MRPVPWNPAHPAQAVSVVGEAVATVVVVAVVAVAVAVAMAAAAGVAAKVATVVEAVKVVVPGGTVGGIMVGGTAVTVPSGICKYCPAKIKFGLGILLTCTNVSTVVPNRREIPQSVSPHWIW